MKVGLKKEIRERQLGGTGISGKGRWTPSHSTCWLEIVGGGEIEGGIWFRGSRNSDWGGARTGGGLGKFL